MIMVKNDFQEYICRLYCLYFKDGQKEAMACRGAQVVHSLVCNKQLDLVKMPPLMKEPALWQQYKQKIGSSICITCPFRAEDCDFQSEKPENYGEPCGGFILLAHLRAHNLINESDLIG